MLPGYPLAKYNVAKLLAGKLRKNLILLQRDEIPTKYGKGNIIIPETDRFPAVTGTVVKISEEVENDPTFKDIRPGKKIGLPSCFYWSNPGEPGWESFCDEDDDTKVYALLDLNHVNNVANAVVFNESETRYTHFFCCACRKHWSVRKDALFCVDCPGGVSFKCELCGKFDSPPLVIVPFD